MLLFFFSSRRRHTRYWRDWEFRRVLFRSNPDEHLLEGRRHLFAPEALEDYLRCFRNPQTRHAICEDYRAAATLDFDHDEADRQARRGIGCPVLALWGRQGSLEEWYDVVGIWRGWADEARGRAIDC